MRVKVEKRSLAWYIKHHIEPLFVDVRKNDTVASETR